LRPPMTSGTSVWSRRGRQSAMADGRRSEDQGSLGAERLPALIATCARQHHVDLTTAASGANEPVPPVENRRLSTVQLRLFRRIWLDLMLTRLAPHDEPLAGGRRAPEGHRWPRLRLAPPGALSGVSVWLSLVVAHIASAVAGEARARA